LNKKGLRTKNKSNLFFLVRVKGYSQSKKDD